MPAPDDRLTLLLGEAVKATWGELPQPIQERLFEAALRSAGGEAAEELRHRLALMLHDEHPRTAEHV